MTTKIRGIVAGLLAVALVAGGGYAVYAANTFQDLSGAKFGFANLQSHAAGDATADHPIFRCATSVACRIVKVTIIPAAAVTGQATNYFNLNVKSWTAAGVATERANRDYSSGAVTETAMVSRDLYAPATPLSIAAGSHLTLERELVGTGLASPNLGVVIEWTN